MTDARIRTGADATLPSPALPAAAPRGTVEAAVRRGPDPCRPNAAGAGTLMGGAVARAEAIQIDETLATRFPDVRRYADDLAQLRGADPGATIVPARPPR